MSYWKDFTKDLSLARHGEELFDKILSGQGWGTRKADLQEDKEGVDLFANKDGKEITYQIKYGHVMQRTGNLAIEEKEVYDDFRKDKKGWGKKLTSDYVVFVEDLPNSLYYFNIQNIIPCLIEIKKFRTKKLIKNQEKIVSTKNYLNNNLKYTFNFYQIFLK